MEILSETVHMESYILGIFLLGVLDLFMLFLLIGTVASSIMDRDFDWSTFGVICVTLLSLYIFTMGLIIELKDGADVTYKATVTDFNEVYKNGYEIISQEGSIYTLRKSGSK